MLDLNGYQDSNMDVRVFVGSRSTAQRYVWTKPKGAKEVFIFLTGSGGGGGSGFSGASGTTRGGGSGGAPGAITTLTVPAFLIPDNLFLKLAGGAAAAQSDASFPSRILMTDNNDLTNVLIGSGNGAAGSTGTASGGGAAAVGANASTIANGTFLGLGNFKSLSGNVSGAGGAHTGAAGETISALNACLLSGGAGGGGVGADDVNWAGGSVTGVPDIIDTVIGGAAAGGVGNHGIYIRKPFCAVGGAGGGTAGASGTGGNGGDGSYGCGGGGGGAGVTGGTGGRGGPSIAFIISFF